MPIEQATVNARRTSYIVVAWFVKFLKILNFGAILTIQMYSNVYLIF